MPLFSGRFSCTFTPKSDQVQISPVASPVILHHTVWRTWLFIAYSDWKMILVPVLTTLLIHFSGKGWENVLFELGIERVKGNSRISCAEKEDNMFRRIARWSFSGVHYSTSMCESVSQNCETTCSSRKCRLVWRALQTLIWSNIPRPNIFGGWPLRNINN